MKVVEKIKAALVEHWMTELDREIMAEGRQARAQRVENLKRHRNFPHGRGFVISEGFGGMYQATDGQSEYWLNQSVPRWICMTGPDLTLPRNEHGDINT